MFLTNLCLFLTFVFVVFSYAPFENLNGLEDDIPQWITIPENDKTCNLKVKQNWPGEKHPYIVGKGSVAKPSGKYFNRPRYYIKKRKLDDNQIQFVALNDPSATAVREEEPNKFSRQLFALFCQQGTISAIDSKTRVYGRHTRGKCGIEDQFVEFCLLDQDVGSLTNVDQLFEFQSPNPNMRTVDVNVAKYNIMAGLCDRFVGMKLPEKNTPIIKALPLIGYYLKGAKRANFDKVLMLAFDISHEDCEARHLCWVNYSVDNLIGDTNLVQTIYRQSTLKELPSIWYFCKENDDDNDDDNQASRSSNLNRFHWLLIEYHQDSRTPNLKRVHG